MNKGGPTLSEARKVMLSSGAKILDDAPTEADLRTPVNYKKVLVIVDVQKDYARDLCCGTPPSLSCQQNPPSACTPAEPLASVSPWAGDLQTASNGVPALSDRILNVYNLGRPWDAVVFTRDFLDPGVVVNHETGYSSLVGRSLGEHDGYGDGADVIDPLWGPDSVIRENEYEANNFIDFTKSFDDWMNVVDETCPSPTGDGQHHFSRNNERIEGNNHPTLKEMILHKLSQPGRPPVCPRDVRMVVTGIETVRCIMKGTVHAVMDGFDVLVPLQATAGGQASEREEWRPCPRDQWQQHVNAPDFDDSPCKERETDAPGIAHSCHNPVYRRRWYQMLGEDESEHGAFVRTDG